MMKAASTILALMLLPSATTTSVRRLKGAEVRAGGEESSVATNGDPTPAAAAVRRRTRSSAGSSAARADPDRPPPRELCSAFMIYDFLTRRMERQRAPDDRVNIDWASACPALRDLNPELCPAGERLADVCTEPYRVDLNPSVNHDYCQPLMAGIEDDRDFLDCVRACVRYVSRDRGDCCQFVCP